MITSSREHLLGYLLGALEAEDEAAVEDELRRSPRLQEELQRLRRKLAPLETTRRDFDPPAGLAQRTCVHVALAGPRRLPDSPRRPAAAEPAVAPLAAPRRWTLADVVVLGGVVAAMLLILFPALLSNIDLARREQCQYNMQTVGEQLVKFSELAADGRFPWIPTAGNRSFSGVVAPILHERQLLSRPSALICPSSPLADSGWQVVTLQQIDAARGEQLRGLQQRALGSMGYNLGVTVDGQYQAPKNRSRSNFVLMTDAPCPKTASVSANHGRGQNMLFEDNHTAYVLGCRVPGCRDDVFRNRRGVVEAGVGADDSVVARSATPPLRRTP